MSGIRYSGHYYTPQGGGGGAGGASGTGSGSFGHPTGSGSGTFTPASGVTGSGSGSFGQPTGSGSGTVSAPASGTLALNDLSAERVYQRSGSAAAVAVSGTYTGAVPASVKIPVLNYSDGTTVQAATALTGFTASGGNWSGTLSVPASTTPYKLGAAVGYDSGGSPISGETSSAGTNRFFVGDLWVVIGQSVSYTLGGAGSGASRATVAARHYDGGTGGTNSWKITTTQAPLRAAIDAFTGYASVAVGIIDCGTSSIGLDGATGWITTTSAAYQAFLANMAAVGGSAVRIFSWMGGNDVRGNAVPSYAGQLSNYQTVLDRVRSVIGASNAPAFIIGSLSGTVNGSVTSASTGFSGGSDTQWDQCRRAEMALDGYNGCTYYAAQTIDIPLSDGEHATSAGFEEIGDRATLAVKYVDGQSTYYRGPSITSKTLSADKLSIVVKLAHRGGTDFSVSNVDGQIRGFYVFDTGTVVTPSSVVRTDATTITLTFASPLSSAANVSCHYLWGAAPYFYTAYSPASTSSTDYTRVALDNTTGATQPISTGIGLGLPIEMDTTTAVVASGDVTGTGSGSFGHPVGSGSGAYTPTNETGTGSGAFGRPVGSGSGTAVPPADTGTGSGSFGHPVGSGSGSVSPPGGASGTGSGSFQHPTGTGGGTVMPPDDTGTGSGALHKPSGSGTGVVAAPGGSAGSGSGSLGGVGGSGSGTVTAPSTTHHPASPRGSALPRYGR